MSSFISPLAGMASAQARFDAAASRISHAGSMADGLAGDSVDLSAEMVAILESKNAFAANVKTAQAADELEKSTLNILG